MLYEATNRFGGWISSENHDGYFFESTARTLRPKGITGNTTLELLHLLGLEDKVVPIKSDRVAGKFRLTWSGNQIHAVTPAIDADLKVLFGSEATDGESIYDFTVRRLGKQLADEVISPMVCGICAGDAKEISAKFLVKGRDSREFEPVALYEKAREERWNFYSLERGLETLPKAITAKLEENRKVQLNLESKCKKISFEADGTVTVPIDGQHHSTDHLISSLPSFRLASLLDHQHPSLASELREMKSADVAMVNLHFPSGNLLQQKGFGMFVPAMENSPLLGIIFDSCCVDSKGTTLTAMIGESFLKANPDEKMLLETSVKHVAEILGINEEPDNVKVNVLRKCFPQYTVGHYERLDRIKNYIKSNKLSLSLCGQSYDGIGINEVILSAKVAASEVNM